MSLAAALERAATALEAEADGIRPANGDPDRLRRELAPQAGGRVLAWLLTHEPAAGEELAQAWAEDPEAREHLLAVDEPALSKTGRKTLRRVLHRLRGRGVALPEAPPAPVVATLPPLDDSLEAALVSPLDPSGARMAYLVESSPGGGVRIFEIVFDSALGVLDCAAYATGRSQARQFLRDAQKRRFPALPVPADSLRGLLAEAARAHPPEKALPRDFSESRGRLTRAPEDARTPGELAREALGAAGGSLARAAELIRERQVGPWPTSEAALRSVAEQLQEIAVGKIIVSGPQRRERIDAVLGEALGTVYDAPACDQMRRRFEETAFVLWKQEREDDARACLAAARSFGDTAPGENPIARALLEAALAPLLERLREEESEDSSLIVKP